MSKGIGGHENKRSQTQEWLTPPWILERLGRFNLDPCAPIERPWDTADKHYTTEDDGLALPWNGRVWLNPPYNNVDLWLKKLANHGDGIALIYARTETAHFFRCVWEVADGILFLRKRIKFYYPDGTMSDTNSGAPSVLIAYGDENVQSLRESNIPGALVMRNEVIVAESIFEKEVFEPPPELPLQKKICHKLKWLLGWRYLGCVGLWKFFTRGKRNLFTIPVLRSTENAPFRQSIRNTLKGRKP